MQLFRKCPSLRKADTSAVDEDFASMNSLIAWNISKVLESNPNIDLKVKYNNNDNITITIMLNIIF